MLLKERLRNRTKSYRITAAGYTAYRNGAAGPARVALAYGNGVAASGGGRIGHAGSAGGNGDSVLVPLAAQAGFISPAVDGSQGVAGIRRGSVSPAFLNLDRPGQRGVGSGPGQPVRAVIMMNNSATAAIPAFAKVIRLILSLLL